MAKISISDVLRNRRRLRITTLLACLVLFLALGQMIISSGSKKAQAIGGWSSIDKNAKCVGTSAVRNIPADCEFADVVINGAATVYTDEIRVWQGETSTHPECLSTITYVGKDWQFESLGTENPPQCHYVHTNGTVTYKLGGNVYGDPVYCPASFYYSDGSIYPFAYGTPDPPSDYHNQSYSCWYSVVTSTTDRMVIPDNLVKGNFAHVAGDQCMYSLESGYRTDFTNFTDCDSKRHFRTLTLRNGAVLTHAPIEISDMAEDTARDYNSATQSYDAIINGSLADNKTGVARWKKVDIEVTGETKLESGSSVNVDGKGYPATTTAADIRGKGWGPGGGGNTSSENNAGMWGGGGGYGNDGATGLSSSAMLVPSIGGIHNGDADVSVFEWGSAGGWGERRDHDRHSVGGAGGGRIRINTDVLNIASDDSPHISANGLDGAFDLAYSVHGGGGSGGSIRIVVASKYIGNTIQAHADGYKRSFTSPLDFNQNGSVKILNLSSNNTSGPIVSSYGGLAKRDTDAYDWGVNVGAGAGGRIYIEVTSSGSGVTVTKKLKPISRNDVANTGFNPYALQMGDVIQVVIKLGSYTGTVNLTDEFLHIPGSKVCVSPVSGQPATSPPPLPTSLIPNTIVWNGLQAAMYADGLNPIYYYCKVQ